jgi:uncharacterized protein YecT (DUF1311 family)
VFARRLRLAALLCLPGLPASAAPDGLIDIPGTTPACAKAADNVACLAKLQTRSAARVDATLAKARAALAKSATIDPAERPAALATLARTQQAWRAYVRARCEGEVAVAFTGGTGRNPAQLTCLRIHDERRAAELADLAEMN